MSSIHLRRHEIMLLPDSARVVIRPFIPANTNRVVAILGRVLELTEEEVMSELETVHRESHVA